MLEIKNTGVVVAGLSVNIVHVGNKLPMQRGFFKNNVGNLLPALRFLGSCNLVSM